MSITASSVQLEAKVSASGVEEANRKLESVGKTSDHLASHAGALLAGATAVGGAALIAMGVHATHMAGDFESATTTLVTGAGEQLKNLDMVRQGELALSVQTGETTDQLTSGMFMIESAGYHGAAGLQVLKDAAEGAKVGAADLGTVADGTTTIMTDYARAHETSAQAVNFLVATVASGKTHMTDLAASLAMILPTASALRVHLNDVGGAMATMTGEGVPAADAATYLRQTLMALEKPSHGAQVALKEIGLSASDLATEMQKSLPGALQMLEDHLKKKFPEGSVAYNDALAAIAGGSKQMQGMLDLTGDHLKTFKGNVDTISGAVKEGGKNITGWALVQQDFNTKMDQAHAVVDKFFIQLGTALLPQLGKLSDWFVRTGQPALEKFSDWIIKTALPNITIFGEWFVKKAIPNLQSMADTVVKTLLPPLLSLAENVWTLITRFGAWSVNSGLLMTAIQDVSTVLGTLVGWVSDLIDGLNTGNPAVALLAGGLTSVATAIGLLKLEEFGAGLYNSFQKLQAGEGIVANLATKWFPQLTTALGGTKTAVAAVGTEAAAAEVEVETAAGGMSLALGAATVGISLLVGGAVVAITGLATQLNDVESRMASDVKTNYDQLGTSVADSQAKVEASAEYSVQGAQISYSRGAGEIVKSMDDAKAKVIVDHQLMADAAEKQAARMVAAAQKADSAWTQASQDMNLHDLLTQSGWTPAQIAKYTGGVSYSDNPDPTVHRHASGTSNAPGGLSLLGEGKEPEIVMGPTLGNLARGSQVIPFSQLRGGGDSAPIIHIHPPDLYLDGTRLTQAQLPYLANALRAGLGVIGQ